MRGEYTNEELAVRIKAGRRDLLPLLWAKNRRSIYLMAVKYRTIIRQHAFVDLEDFLQCGYFALVDALEAYNPAKGWKLSAYLNFAYKRQVYAMFGNAREGDAYIFPSAPSSLNVPIENKDGHETEVMDLLEDENAGRLEEDCEKEELRRIVRAAVDKLPKRERFVIRALYFEERTKTELADGSALRINFTLRGLKIPLCYSCGAIGNCGSFTGPIFQNSRQSRTKCGQRRKRRQWRKKAGKNGSGARQSR